MSTPEWLDIKQWVPEDCHDVYAIVECNVTQTGSGGVRVAVQPPKLVVLNLVDGEWRHADDGRPLLFYSVVGWRYADD